MQRVFAVSAFHGLNADSGGAGHALVPNGGVELAGFEVLGEDGFLGRRGGGDQSKRGKSSDHVCEFII